MEKPSKRTKKTPSKKTSDAGKITKKPKAAPSRKVSSSKKIKSKPDRVKTPTEAESQHRYFEDLGSRLAERAYELYVQRGKEDGHDIEDWLEAERQILPKEISERG